MKTNILNFILDRPADFARLVVKQKQSIDLQRRVGKEDVHQIVLHECLLEIFQYLQGKYADTPVHELPIDQFPKDDRILEIVSKKCAANDMSADEILEECLSLTQSMTLCEGSTLPATEFIRNVGGLEVRQLIDELLQAAESKDIPITKETEAGVYEMPLSLLSRLRHKKDTVTTYVTNQEHDEKKTDAENLQIADLLETQIREQLQLVCDNQGYLVKRAS